LSWAKVEPERSRPRRPAGHGLSRARLWQAGRGLGGGASAGGPHPGR